jgi:hypothetical protein
VQIDGSVLTKTITVAAGPARRSAKRPGANLLDQLLHPTEQPLSSAAVAAIEVRYAGGEVNLLGWEIHWLIAFFILTLAAAFALRRPLRVTF